MTGSSFILRRLIVAQGGHKAYDEAFHPTVNIIRGENGAGKSTLADFIFYVLGGEFDDWKAAAQRCDVVTAEVVTANGVLTLRRAIAGKLEPIWAFFGPLENASKTAVEGWQRFSIRRASASSSFSQMMFRACGIPEAPSEGASNVTMHQILRLLYADQRTPASRLFRFERFDTRDLRSATGELLLGVNTYEGYEIELQLRELSSRFDNLSKDLSSLLSAIAMSERDVDIRSVDIQLADLEAERTRTLAEIEQPDAHFDPADLSKFETVRRKTATTLRRSRSEVSRLEELVHKTELETTELEKYIGFLEDLHESVKHSARTADLLGAIDFAYCPACLQPLAAHTDEYHCSVCGSDVDAEKHKDRYLQVKVDLKTQISQSKQLLEGQANERQSLIQELRIKRSDYERLFGQFLAEYGSVSSPLESFLAARNQRLGLLNTEIQHLNDRRRLSERVDALTQEKARIAFEISHLRSRQERTQKSHWKRSQEAMASVSSIARDLLMEDLPRQEEFEKPHSVVIDFADDAILVDGKMNFAESSNVFLKNACILAMWAAATQDGLFWHPRFALFDNVEDKGMESIRSHRFQQLIVQCATRAKYKGQIIFTTSMMNPELDIPELVVGPAYYSRHTLELRDAL